MLDQDLPALHRRALADSRRVMKGIAADQWGGATPCADWDVRALANHVVAGNWWAAELGAGRTIAAVGDRLDGDVLGDDPWGAFDESAAAAAAVFERPGAMGAPCAVSYGPVPGSVYCGHRFIDVLIHGWDLATATGQSAALDEDLVAACLDVVRPQAAMLAGSGAFGSGVTAVGTSPQSELLALLGRNG